MSTPQKYFRPHPTLRKEFEDASARHVGKLGTGDSQILESLMLFWLENPDQRQALSARLYEWRLDHPDEDEHEDLRKDAAHGPPKGPKKK